MKVEKIIIEKTDLEEIKQQLKKKIISSPRHGKKIELETDFEDYLAFVQFRVSVNDEDLYTAQDIEIYISFNCIADSDGTLAEIKVEEKEWKDFVDCIEYLLNS